MSDSDDDKPQLSEETLKILQEHYAQTLREKVLNNTGESNECTNENTLEEDWQLSQFWYDDKTTDVLAKEAVRVAGSSGRIALISCPTLYNRLKSISPSCQVTLFEFDQRFARHGEDFISYDYKNPLDIPRDLAEVFDIVLADPPFLSEECLTKTAVTIKFLTNRKIVLCTGAIMEDLAKRLLNLSKANFEPKHQNNLANEFSCFSNYNIDEHITVEPIS